jgi:putative transposase
MSNAYAIRQSGGTYFVTSTVTGWVDVFTRQRYRDIVLDSLSFCIRQKGLTVHAWVVMSNHLHLIASVSDEAYLSNVLRDFKSFTSKAILHSIATEAGESRKEWMLALFGTAGKMNAANTGFQLWQNGNRAVSLYSPAVLKQKLDYVHNNPARNGLVALPEHYLYSSAKDYIGEKGLLDIEPFILKEFVRR